MNTIRGEVLKGAVITALVLSVIGSVPSMAQEHGSTPPAKVGGEVESESRAHEHDEEGERVLVYGVSLTYGW